MSNEELWKSRKHTSPSATNFQIAKEADLLNASDVETWISNTKVTDATKQKFVNIYHYFCTVNRIQWKKPRYKYERKIPLIPTTENIHKIISACSPKYATIFKILEETGLEGQELAITNRQDIDAEQGIINVQGCKGHNSRMCKLKPQTVDLLRVYLHKYPTPKPFPHPNKNG